MATSTRAASAASGIHPAGVAAPIGARAAARRRQIALRLTAGITVGCLHAGSKPAKSEGA